MLSLGTVDLLTGCTTQEAPKSEQPMVVLVSIDTLRADHLSSYGYERRTSPFWDELANNGTRFEYARSASSLDVASACHDVDWSVACNTSHCR